MPTPNQRLSLALVLILLSFAVASAGATTVRRGLPTTDGTVRCLLTRGDTLVLGGLFTRFRMPTGGLAALDGRTSAVDHGFPTVDGILYAIVSDGAGGWYLGGEFTAVGGLSHRNLAHVLADHSLDSWAPVPDAPVRALAVTASRVYAGGDFTHVGIAARSYVAAFDRPSGDLAAWSPALSARVWVLAASDAAIYAGGEFTVVGDVFRMYVAAFDPASGALTSWDPGANGTVRAIYPTPNRVYIGGAFSVIGQAFRNGAAAVDPQTGALSAWSPSLKGIVTNLLPDAGRVLIAGAIYGTRTGLAAADTTTGGLLSWGPSASNVDALALTDSSIVAIGSFTYASGVKRNRYAAFRRFGGMELLGSFAPLDDQAYCVAVGGGQILVGGQFTAADSGTVVPANLAMIQCSTGELLPWDAHVNNSVSAMALRGDTLYLGGAFTTVGNLGLGRSRAAAVLLSTGTVTEWNPSVTQAYNNGAVRTLAFHGGNVILGGVFDHVGGQARNAAAEVDGVLGALTTWNVHTAPDYTPAVYALAVKGDTIFVGGSFSGIGGYVRNNLAAVNGTAGVAYGWNPGPTYPVYALLPDGSRLYVGGSSYSGGSNLKAYDAGTFAELTTFAPTTIASSVYAIALLGDHVVAGGLNGYGSPTTLQAFHAGNGVEDPDWAVRVEGSPANLYAYVNTLATYSGTVFVGGTYQYVGGAAHPNFAQLGFPPTASVAVSLERAEAAAGRVNLAWRVAGAPPLITVQRRDADSAAAWTDRATVPVGDSGLVAFVDTTVVSGARYGYRVVFTVQGTQHASDAVWLDVPFPPVPPPVPVLALALAGARPNPSTGGLAVAFTLAGSRPATLEAFDLAGRRVRSRSVGGLGPGEHVVDLDPAGALPTGLYLLRLEQGGRALTTRAVRLR
jgi:trimeric autotransporter adhesin